MYMLVYKIKVDNGCENNSWFEEYVYLRKGSMLRSIVLFGFNFYGLMGRVFLGCKVVFLVCLLR